MKVKLISYTVATEDLYKSGIEDGVDLINYCAMQMPVIRRLPNSLNRDELVAKLIKNQWWNPLELIAMTVEIETTVDLAKELFKHKSFTFQPVQDNLNFVIHEVAFYNRTSPNNFSNIFQNDEVKTAELNSEWKQRQQEIIDLSLDTYNWAKSNSMPEQLAQSVLPAGNTLTKIYMHGNLRRWINFLETRGSPGLHNTKHQAISLACAEVIASAFPNIDTYLNKTLK